MTHVEWIAAGRPHWQCPICKGIYITAAPPDDLICWQCISTMPANSLALETAKPAKFTAEELRKIEDAVKKEIDGQDELRRAIGYAYLNGLGWRMMRAQQVIDKALK